MSPFFRLTCPAEKAAAAPTSAPAAKPTGKPIKIGFITPLTWRVAGYGARQKIAVQLALEDVNSRSGINGSPLEVVMVDDQADPFETGTTDFSAIITKIKGLNPDGIAYSSLTPEALGFAKELQKQGVKAPVMASSQNYSGPEITLGKDVLEGWVASGNFDEDTQDPVARGVVDRFVKAGAADPAVHRAPLLGINLLLKRLPLNQASHEVLSYQTRCLSSGFESYHSRRLDSIAHVIEVLDGRLLW